MFISLLAQRNEPKKGHPVSLVPPMAGYPALLKTAGMLQTRCAQTVQPPFSAVFPVLGGVPMGILSPHLSCRASQMGAEKDAKTV
ncbi:MAG: hypothetical protein ACYDIB_00365 [Desulfobulbia bacterium]